MRLALGTAQFGSSYGVANTSGQVPLTQVQTLLDLARKHGVDTLDTAIGYGQSEAVLGQGGTSGFRLITKLPALPEDIEAVEPWVSQQVKASMDRMRAPKIHGLLLHRPTQLLQPKGAALAQALRSLQEKGWVERVGISIYAPEELEPVLQVFTPDLVQAPLNLVDRRLVESGWLARLQAMGVAVHARSIFLQGLLLMPREARPPQFAAWQPLWQQWQEWLDAHSEHSPQSACLAYALSHPAIERVVVGVDNPQQFEQLVQTLQCEPIGWPDLACDDLRLINPSHWQSL